MKVHGSARKHGVEPDDAVYAAEHALFVSDLDVYLAMPVAAWAESENR